MICASVIIKESVAYYVKSRVDLTSSMFLNFIIIIIAYLQRCPEMWYVQEPSNLTL